MKKRATGYRLLAAWLILGLAACGSSPVYERETFDANSPFQRRIPTALDPACEGARLALLSQGYTVDDTRPHHLKGTKSFQPDEDEHVTIEFDVVCAMTRSDTTLYANAVETRYDIKKSKQAAGISIPSVGSLNLPWGSTTESLVKVSGETITDTAFYERFFNLVEQQLGLSPSGKQD
ncbi:MAG: DUF2242 domain-containing protein [Sulfurimicrobium sp.]|nr:DUF2242 domain-containing protein [Sulfurimicrobium sp.]MDO9190094.1 DUF2242 domain-containing protein [Sulfurimicrobium sp.]MDP1704126.1 DUF2242 domain-containing protein [Sulfurimicrobium sp.]MDP2197198.1 DUF2242 domain-containing protein [Sulfurimicrobium sp.]MDP3687115.1 DUF2242 domain-containing protein [Sulfurimicrobium sp.]